MIQRASLPALLVAFSLLFLPVAARSAPNPKMIQALNAAAQKDFDAGNFEKAANAFLEIYKQDPAQPTALYNAARGFHFSGNLDKAEECYRKYLALGDTAPEKLPKIEGYLKDLQQKRADLKAQQARAAEQNAQFAVAAELWAEAAQLAPENTAFLARAGRAAQLAGQKDKAIGAYKLYLERAAADAKDRADVTKWNAELTPTVAARPADGSKSAPVSLPEGYRPDSGAAVVEPTTPTRILPVATLGGGAVVAVVGGVILFLAHKDETALTDSYSKTNSSGFINGTTLSAAQAEASRIEGQYLLGWATAGVGVAAAGVGTWLLMRSPEGKLAIMPTWNGFAVAGRF